MSSGEEIVVNFAAMLSREEAMKRYFEKGGIVSTVHLFQMKVPPDATIGDLQLLLEKDPTYGNRAWSISVANPSEVRVQDLAVGSKNLVIRLPNYELSPLQNREAGLKIVEIASLLAGEVANRDKVRAVQDVLRPLRTRLAELIGLRVSSSTASSSASSTASGLSEEEEKEYTKIQSQVSHIENTVIVPLLSRTRELEKMMEEQIYLAYGTRTPVVHPDMTISSYTARLCQ